MVYQIQSLLKRDDSITVAFSGSGDSGDDNEIVTNNEDLLALQVRIPGIEASYDATTKAWNHTTCWKTLSVSDAVNVLCDNVIKEAGFDGYENDAGGQGEITIERDVLRFEASHTVEEASPTATIFSLDEGDCKATVDVGADDGFTRYVMSEPVLQKEAA